LGCFGMTAITALTAQNTCGVRAIHGVPPEILRDQIDAVVEDIGIDAVKIGMLHSPEIVRTVAQALARHNLPHVVFDPVMVATNGAKLITDEAITVLVTELFPRAAVITPNLDEAGLLVGRTLRSQPDMLSAAQTLLGQGARAVLLKGGHLAGDDVADLLLLPNAEPIWLHGPRIQTANTHGTGCTLSSAIAAHLGLGLGLMDAVRAARAYIRQALQAGATVKTGHGSGPLNHSFAPLPMRLL